MRPAASFTLHAILAACLAALAATSAAAKPAGDGTTEQFFTIHLQEGRALQGSQGQQLEVHSYHWGAVPSGYRLDRNVKSWSTSGDGTGASSGGGRNQLGMDDTAGKEKMRPGAGPGAASGRVTGIATDPADPAAHVGRGVDIARVDGQISPSVGAPEKITVGSGRTEARTLPRELPVMSSIVESSSDQATGKRQHKPLVMRGYYDQSAPPQRGILTVLASGGSCRVGVRYPSLALSGGGKQYLLKDVRVVACGDPSAVGPTEEITFVYGQVRVRGWDPEKKEN